MSKTISRLVFLVLIFIFSKILIPVILIFQKFRHKKQFSDYVYVCILGEDQKFSNYIYGRRGQDFYISSVAFYDAEIKKKNIWFKNLIDWLFLKLFDEKEHCKKSYENDVKNLGFLPAFDSEGNFIEEKRNKNV